LVQEVLNATAANSRIMTENEQTNEIWNKISSKTWNTLYTYLEELKCCFVNDWNPKHTDLQNIVMYFDRFEIDSQNYKLICVLQNH
jgi:hypothetical protein